MPYIILFAKALEIGSTKKVRLLGPGSSQNEFFMSLGAHFEKKSDLFRWEIGSPLEALEVLETHGWIVVASAVKGENSLYQQYTWTLRKTA